MSHLIFASIVIFNTKCKYSNLPYPQSLAPQQNPKKGIKPLIVAFPHLQMLTFGISP